MSPPIELLQAHLKVHLPAYQDGYTFGLIVEINHTKNKPNTNNPSGLCKWYKNVFGRMKSRTHMFSYPIY
jgi:hypothetical protein